MINTTKHFKVAGYKVFKRIAKTQILVLQPHCLTTVASLETKQGNKLACLATNYGAQLKY